MKALSQNQTRVLRASYRLLVKENCKPICIEAGHKMRRWSRFVTGQSGAAIDEICPATLLARLEQLNFQGWPDSGGLEKLKTTQPGNAEKKPTLKKVEAGAPGGTDCGAVVRRRRGRTLKPSASLRHFH